MFIEVTRVRASFI